MVEPFERLTFTDEAINRAAHKSTTCITLAHPSAAQGCQIQTVSLFLTHTHTTENHSHFGEYLLDSFSAEAEDQ